LLITGEPPKQAEDRKKPNPSACTGLAEHLLPRRHGLIQSFPNESAEDDAEAELWAQVDNHKCQSGDANPEHAKPASVGYGVSPTHLSNSKWVPSVRP